jgi:hypothetical protein
MDLLPSTYHTLILVTRPPDELHIRDAGVNADVPPPAGSNSPVPAGSPIRVRISTADTIAIETLEARLRIAVAEAHGQIVGPARFCAWTRV